MPGKIDNPVVNKGDFEMDGSEPKTLTVVKKKRGKPFKKGESGNKLGKRRGTRNKATLAAEALLDGARLALTQKLIDKALDGDMAAMRLVAPHILPSPERKLIFKLPPLKTAADAMTAIAKIAQGVGQGELSASDAQVLNGIVQTFLQGCAQIETNLLLTALEESVAILEAEANERKNPRPMPKFKTYSGPGEAT